MKNFEEYHHSTMGNPFSWSPITYRLKVNNREVTERACSSLICLIKAFNPEIVLILAPETLLCPGVRYEEKYRKKGGLLFTEKVKGSCNIRSTISNYKELISSLRRAIENLYEEWIGKEIPHKYKVTIMPNVGKYTCSNPSDLQERIGIWWRIGIKKVNPVSAYAAYTLISIISSINEIIERDEIKSLRLVLDTTHGINYMPIAAIRYAIIEVIDKARDDPNVLSKVVSEIRKMLKEKRGKLVTLTIPREYFRVIERVSEKLNVSRSDVIRAFIKVWLNNFLKRRNNF